MANNHVCWILYSGLRSVKSQYPTPFAISTDGGNALFLGQRGALGARGMQFRIAALAEAQQLLYESDQDEEQALWEALEQLADRYDPTDFDVAALRADIEHDRRLLLQMLALVQPLTPERDANLQTLRARLSQPPLAGEKVLTLTQYADTAQ